MSKVAGSVPTVQRAPALAASDRDAEARAWIQALPATVRSERRPRSAYTLC